VLLLSQYRFTKTRNTFILLSRAFGGLICTAISNFSLSQGIESPPTSAIFYFDGMMADAVHAAAVEAKGRLLLRSPAVPAVEM
jgi:hypothetical protein